MHPTPLRTGALSLRETLTKARFFRTCDIQLRSTSADWNACRPGDVFFAIMAAGDDGHEHAALAVERGAVAIVGERLLPVDVPQVLVPDSRSAFATVCQALAGSPSRSLRTLGVAGTAGKTVTSILLASVLEAAGQAAGVLSSIGWSDSATQRVGASGTPSAAEFAAWLRRMTTAGCEAAVLELSSRALAERRTSGIELDVAILTSMQPGSLSEHNTARAQQRVLRRAFGHLKPGGVAIVNADDHRCRNMIAKRKRPCLTYALRAEADLTAMVLERCPGEQTFLLRAGDSDVPVRTRIAGDMHVSSCLAATATALALGIDLPTIVRGLEAVERIPGRMERLECGQLFGVYVDAAHSPQAMAQAMKAVRQVTRGRLFVVAGARGGADRSRRALLGRVLERGCHVPVLTSDDPRYEEPLEIAHGLLDGFDRPHKAHVIPDRAAAIRFALSQAGTGDAVLIAGKGDRLGQLIGKRRLPHDDRQVASQWLQERDATPSGPRPRFRIVG